MSDRKIKVLIATAQALENEKLTEKGDVVALRTKNGMLATSPDILPSALTEKDVTEVKRGEAGNSLYALCLAVFAHREDVNSVIINHAPYCRIVGETVKKLPAVLDDMAQIIGATARVAKTRNAPDVLKALEGRNACLVKDGAVVAVGVTPDEAYTASLVLEKGAKAYIEGTVLGGAVKIPLGEALLMRFVYKKKYSKGDQSEKLKEIAE